MNLLVVRYTHLILDNTIYTCRITQVTVSTKPDVALVAKIPNGVHYLYKLLCENVIRKFEFVVNSGDNDMKLDGNVEKKPMLKESDETPVLSEVVTDETKPVEAPVEDKKPL